MSIVASESSCVLPPFPAEHLQDACGFLPELATQLATVQTTQDVEVEEKQRQLLQLKDELNKENEKVKLVIACVCSTSKAITLARDRAAQTSLSCQQLEKNITRLVAGREDLRHKLGSLAQEREEGQRQREEYRKKMAAHRERVLAVEQDSAVHKELAELQVKKQHMESNRAEYMHGGGLMVLSGQRHKQLQESIIASETLCALLDEDTTEVREKKKLSEGQVQMWRKEMEVSRKRRQALLTRLRRQLQEAQGRRRQWSQQVDTLQSAISLLRQKLTDSS